MDGEDQQVLHNLIISATNENQANSNAVKAVSDSANILYDAVVTTKQMEDLDGKYKITLPLIPSQLFIDEKTFRGKLCYYLFLPQE